MHCSMNYLKSLILILFTFVCFSATAEEETITFLPSQVYSTIKINDFKSPDQISYGGVTISAEFANFNRGMYDRYKLYAYSLITFASESNIKKIVINRYTSSGKPFVANNDRNIGIPGKLKVEDNIVTWNAESALTNSVSFEVSNGDAVHIRPFEVTVEKKTGEEITLSSLGYATMYYGTKSLVVPSGIEAMTYTVDGKKLVCSKTYRAGETIPQATGVVLKGDAGTYTFNYSDETGVAPSGNLLSGSDAEQATSGAGLFYKLAQDPDNAQNVGFFWGADNGGAFTNGAHKAYLCVPASAGVRAFILLNEEATAINKLSTDIQTHETYYTLGGQQLSEKPAKGAVIVSKGKKFVVR